MNDGGVAGTRRHGQGALALGIAGTAFAAYPASRPYPDGPAVWTQFWWVPAHLLGVIAFASLVPGLAVWWSVHRGTAGERPAWAALIVCGVGTALVLPYYGAESFGLAALGAAVPGGVAPAVADAVAEQVRMAPLPAATFLAGLLALAAAGVLVAVAAVRGGRVPVVPAVLLAAGLVLYLPQFFAPAPVRIAHGVLLAAGCLLTALTLHRAPAPSRHPAT